MTITKFGCEFIECNCRCDACGTEQVFKYHMGCCPGEIGPCKEIDNRCYKCGSPLSIAGITEDCAFYHIFERGPIGPSGPITMKDPT